MQDRGLRRGDRFGICRPNCPYFILLYFAALHAGATVVSFNPLYTEREIKHLIRDSGARMMAVPDLARCMARSRRSRAGPVSKRSWCAKCRPCCRWARRWASPCSSGATMPGSAMSRCT
ncbi:AMP-binding protein [Novosphingobium piscinae]|uniref:AMP-binding protein n=1 Tax=Novosphingobium piscinae TaxID=1507448 RepID=UPI001FE3C8A3